MKEKLNESGGSQVQDSTSEDKNLLDGPPLPQKEDLLDDQNLFFSINEDGINPVHISNTPIFELDGKVYFIVPLQPILIENSDDDKKDSQTLLPPISRVGVYGSIAGYGTDPMEFYSELEGAKHRAIITEVNTLINSDQTRSIEYGIKEVIDNNETGERSSELLLKKIGVVRSESIISKIKAKIKYYIKLDYDIQYTIATCFILGTYIFLLFSTFGYLIVSGEKGSGKGTFLDVMEKTCWNATGKQISISEAVLFRRIAEQSPTLIIDEYHRAIRNKNSGNALISIIESGYERGGVVPRAEEDKDGPHPYKIVDYPVYCPKIMATRKPVEADDKSIKIIMPKLVTDKEYAKRKNELNNDSFFRNVRLNIMKWCISSQDDILSKYRSIEPTDKLNGREFNVWLPVLSIAKVAFPGEYEDLIDFVGETVYGTRSSTYEKEHRVLSALFHLFKDGKLEDGGRRLKNPSYKVTNKDIDNTLLDLENEGMHHNKAKSALENLKIVGKHETGSYWIDKIKLENKFEERGFLEKPESEKKENENTVSPFKPDESITQNEEIAIDYRNTTTIEKSILALLADQQNHIYSSIIEDLKHDHDQGEVEDTLMDMRVKGWI